MFSATGVDVNHMNEKGASALLFACMEGQAGIVAKLLSMDSCQVAKLSVSPSSAIYNPAIDKNAVYTPLAVACVNGHTDIVAMLLDTASKVDRAVTDADAAGYSKDGDPSRDVDGDTVNERFSFSITKSVLKKKSNAGGGGGSTTGPIFATPLLVACAHGRTHLVGHLLQRPLIDVTVVDTEQSTALHHAIRSGKDTAMPVLEIFKHSPLLADADFKSLLHLSDINGDTCLHLACELVLVDVARWLISQGALVNVVSTVSGLTPLHIAVKKRKADLVTLLLSHAADPLIPDVSGETAAQLASNLRKDSDIVAKVEAAVALRKAAEQADVQAESVVLDTNNNGRSLIEGNNLLDGADNVAVKEDAVSAAEGASESVLAATTFMTPVRPTRRT
jgi:ankyrin repeat protein